MWAAGGAAMLVWLLVERLSDGQATVLGAVTGAVAGLATITPCAGFVDTYAAVVIGGLAGLICHLALRLKQLLRLDDALDVIAVHLVGGVLGTFLLGFFGDKSINPIGAKPRRGAAGAGGPTERTRRPRPGLRHRRGSARMSVHLGVAGR